MIWAQATARRSSCTARSRRRCCSGYLGQRLKELGLAVRLLPGRARHALRQSGDRGSALDALRAAGSERILVVPLFPQYAASTTAAALDAVFAHVRRRAADAGPALVDGFHDDPRLHPGARANVNDYWMRNGRPEQLVLCSTACRGARSTSATPIIASARRRRACSRASSASTTSSGRSRSSRASAAPNG